LEPSIIKNLIWSYVAFTEHLADCIVVSVANIADRAGLSILVSFRLQVSYPHNSRT